MNPSLRNTLFGYLLLWSTGALIRPTLAQVESTPTPFPQGVVLILIDDIGYGDINALWPSNLETPSLDHLYRESIRLTDFHVGTTCSPTRASLMTGRSVNAGGVWHTIAGREILRESEQTIADVFQTNDWKTGIFGKWHLGEGFPFAPRFRGFDLSVIHGGGGVGQGPDHWGNDYYSGKDFQGNPTRADIYFKNGKHLPSDQHCTDFWFDQAQQFIQECVQQSQPFFCYIPTNAAHSPFNAPFGYKKGFDGLIENVDHNVGRFDKFLDSLGIKDDVLLIFTTDNGTTGKRKGGLRGTKGSYFDGGHNVPCFWRWKQGGIAGTEELARDVDSLAAGMDILPTLVSLLDLEKPTGGNRLHGIDLTEVLIRSNSPKQPRTLVVDTQRTHDLIKWRRACVMQDEVRDGKIVAKWRLTRESPKHETELFDFLTDRDTDADLSEIHGTKIEQLKQAYESWWKEISPGWEAYPTPRAGTPNETELTLFAHSSIRGDGTPWHQSHVRKGFPGTGIHPIQFEPGRYRFELRRWPREDGGTMDGPPSVGSGKVLQVKQALLAIESLEELTVEVQPGDTEAVFETDVHTSEPIQLTAKLLDAAGNSLAGAYYIYIRKADTP